MRFPYKILFNENVKREALEGARLWKNAPFCIPLTATLMVHENGEIKPN
jgi:hypothetical protein